MRHRKKFGKLGRTSSHKKALMRNMLKSFILHKKIKTTQAKAKELQRYTEKLISIAREDTLSKRRLVIKKLGLHYNVLNPKEKRLAKKEDFSSYNDDRRVIDQLFKEISPKYKERKGGYTRVIKIKHRVGDSAPLTFLELVD